MAQQQPTGGNVDHGREPCPDRILDDIGGAFGMGGVGGGIWHLFKGAKNSPSGTRLRGGIEVSLQAFAQQTDWVSAEMATYSFLPAQQFCM